MAKKLLVRTPQTIDGLTLAYDEKRQPIFKETTLELGAKKGFESLNASLPEHLRHELKVIDDGAEEAPSKKIAAKKTTNAKGKEE